VSGENNNDYRILDRVNMRAAKKMAVDSKLLQELVPLNALSPERFREVSEKIVIEEVLAGSYLFRKGDRDNQSIYLLEGKINLIDGFRKVTSEVEAGTDISRYPIANQQPRSLSARAVKKVVIAKVDSSLLDVFLTWDQSSSAEVVEIGAETNKDWMTRLLQSEAFIKIPPSMIQSLLMKMEALPVKAGDTVIRQGDSGDYFYTIHEGRCAVTQIASPDGVEQLLAELSDGDSFGEDALVSDTRRNATVSMLTDGLLMRLAKNDFVELLKNQLVRRVGYEQAAAMVDEGAVWVDVRTPDEYGNGAFEDSVNIPLSRLRNELSELVFNSKYIICCDTGRRSESAGFLLSHKGFDVYVLDGGIPGLSSDAAEPVAQENTADSVDALAEVIEFDGSMRAVVRQSDADSCDMTAVEMESEAADVVLTRQMSDEFETALDEMRTENQALTAQLEAYRTSEERINEQLDQLRGELGESGEKLGLLYAQAKVDAEQLEQLRGELGEAGEKLAVLYGRESEAAEEKQLLQDQYHALQEEFTNRASAYEQEIEQLREQFAEMQSHAGVASDEHQLLLAETAANSEAWRTTEREYEERLQEQTTLSDAYKEELEHLREDFTGLTTRLDEKSAQVDVLEANNAALSEQIGILQTDLQEGRGQLAAVEATAQLQQQESDEQIKTLREALEQQQQQFSEASAKQAAIEESMQAFQRDNEKLCSELRDSSVLLDGQREQLEILQADRQAVEESAHWQQLEWDAERSALQQALEREVQAVSGLREELSLAELQSSEDKSALEAELKAQINKSNEIIEHLEIKQAELKQERSSQADELQVVMSERTQLQQQYDDIEDQNRQLQSEIGSLKQQIESLVSASDEQQQQLLVRLEEVQAKASSIEQSNEEKDVQISSLQEQLAQRGAEYEASQLQYELLQKQQNELRSLLEQQEERAKSLEEENRETVRKAHEDLTRKNDNEKELQGQIDRLRKKLEQQTLDQQKAREGAQDDIEHIRDQLHAERQARAEERSEMAARQRELKEQLAVIATEHEANMSNQTGAIEQARDAARQEEQERLRELLAIHVETEDQLVKLQQELKTAHEEIAELARHEKDRRRIDIDLMEEQNQQAVATILQLESQLKQFTEERDAALHEQQSLRNKMNALRGEVEVARGLMGAGEHVEDPAQLRKELNESKKNIEIALRLRAEAEAIRDRALQERDALQQQLDSGVSSCEPLHVPSLDEDEPGAGQPRPAQHFQQATLPVSPLEREQDRQSGSLVDRKRDDKQRRWLGTAIGLGAVAVCALAGWLFIGVDSPLTGNDVPQQFPTATTPDAEPALENSSELPLVVVQPASPRVEDEIEEESAALEVSIADAGTVMKKEPVPEERQDVPAPEEFTRVTQRPPVIAGRTFRENLQVGGQGPVMVELPAGNYEMGSIGNSLNFDEGPRREVKVTAFSISKFEVTFAEYDRFARATGRRLPYDESWGRADRPAINVSWEDARAYSRWLSEQTGKNYRLPSEAEWEYAARAGSASNFWWHDNSNNLHANCFNCGSEWDGTRTAPVGSFEANDFGLHDVAGNVQEWTADCYHGSYQGAPNDGSAWLFPECTMRVVRGGAYTSPLDSLRSAKRSQYDQDTRLDNLGFRVVREN
jgi:formylglycine-generating enzyme required for sulfatase activity/CRP-like cAMP-binding protein